MKTPKAGIEVFYGGGVVRHGDPVPEDLAPHLDADMLEEYVPPEEEDAASDEDDPPSDEETPTATSADPLPEPELLALPAPELDLEES